MVTAAIELGAGVALMIAPSLVATLLVGAPLPSDVGESVARVCASALLALGVACGLACGDARSRATYAVVVAMLVYNIGAVVVLGFAGVRVRPVGVALWPAVTLHAFMGAWCAAQLANAGSSVWRRAPPLA
jgi:hypothetical protein